MKYQQCEPWEAMKAVSEGKRVAEKQTNNSWKECGDILFHTHSKYALIIEPSFSWDDFDFKGFFAGQRGLTVNIPTHGYYEIVEAPDDDESLCKTGWYAWTGGKCPVPGNVEVEVVTIFDRYHGRDTSNKGRADSYRWEYNSSDSDILVFRLTGEVCEC